MELTVPLSMVSSLLTDHPRAAPHNSSTQLRLYSSEKNHLRNTHTSDSGEHTAETECLHDTLQSGAFTALTTQPYTREVISAGLSSCTEWLDMLPACKGEEKKSSI